MFYSFLFQTGRYATLMFRVFSKPDRWNIFFRQLLKEMEKLGINSLGLSIIISAFIGAVLTIQTQLNTNSPLMPAYTTGFVTRDTLLLEFSSTILCLLLAGKVGSNIASEIGTMRITEQIDALEIMGVNSANYLILPKIIAFVTIIPCLVIISMGVGLVGGYAVAYFSDLVTTTDYIAGIQFYFQPFYIFYSLVKSLFFAFIIVSVSAYYGYYAGFIL